MSFDLTDEMILATLGYREYDIPRFRYVDINFEKKTIEIETRTGGGNRDDYDNKELTENPNYLTDWDNAEDCTYAEFLFKFPEEYEKELLMMQSPEKNGIPAKLIQLTKEVDENKCEEEIEYNHREYREAEARKELVCDFHGADVYKDDNIYIPLTDRGFARLMENRDQHVTKLPLRILPLKLDFETDTKQWKGLGKKTLDARLTISIHKPREIDEFWWDHWKTEYGEKYPNQISLIEKEIKRQKIPMGIHESKIIDYLKEGTKKRLKLDKTIEELESAIKLIHDVDSVATRASLKASHADRELNKIKEDLKNESQRL